MMELVLALGVGLASYQSAEYVDMSAGFHGGATQDGTWGFVIQIENYDEAFDKAWNGKELIVYASVFDGTYAYAAAFEGGPEKPIPATDDKYKDAKGFLVSGSRITVKKGTKYEFFIPWSAFDYKTYNNLQFKIGFYADKKCVGKLEQSFAGPSLESIRVDDYPKLVYATLARFFIKLRESGEKNWQAMHKEAADYLVGRPDVCPPESKKVALSYMQACLFDECPSDDEIRRAAGSFCNYPQVEKTLADLVGLCKHLALSPTSGAVQAILIDTAQVLGMLEMNYKRIIVE